MDCFQSCLCAVFLQHKVNAMVQTGIIRLEEVKVFLCVKLAIVVVYGSGDFSHSRVG